MKNDSGMTINDVARQAGVSKATVSLVMNGSSKVNAKTFGKVVAIIQSLDFQPNEEARKLARRRWSAPIPTV